MQMDIENRKSRLLTQEAQIFLQQEEFSFRPPDGEPEVVEVSSPIPQNWRDLPIMSDSMTPSKK
jgi:hypothetical protein